MIQPVRIITGDVLEGLASLEAGSVHCCVTSPPYWGLRDYGVDGQIGLEPSPDAYVARMVEVFREVRRCLRDDGTMWLNIGDSYSGNASSGGAGKQDTNCRIYGVPTKNGKPKDLCMIPWRVALALQADGWWLRSVIVWAKKSPMPESVTDRPTSSWEPIFLLAKSERYYYDAEAVKEAGSTEPHAPGYVNGAAYAVGPMDRGGHSQREQPDRVWASSGGRNQRNVWHLGPEPYPEAHFATFPTEIPRRAIKDGTSEKGCCGVCGAPHVRRLARTDHEDPSAKGSTFDGGKTGTRDGGERTQKGPRMLKAAAGWDASCTCEAKVVPCTVLDPFLGSGTTLAVARELGRHGVGCELNPEYVKLARDRIGRAEKPTTYRSEKVEDSPLFAECNP